MRYRLAELWVLELCNRYKFNIFIFNLIFLVGIEKKQVPR